MPSALGNDDANSESTFSFLKPLVFNLAGESLVLQGPKAYSRMELKTCRCSAVAPGGAHHGLAFGSCLCSAGPGVPIPPALHPHSRHTFWHVTGAWLMFVWDLVSNLGKGQIL